MENQMRETIGIGVDLVEVNRLLAGQEGLMERLLTEREREWCRRSARSLERLAGRFAAKEAVLKALGTGLKEGMSWQQIEILPNASGAPVVELFGMADERYREIGGQKILLSIAHDGGMAIAYAQIVGVAIGRS